MKHCNGEISVVRKYWLKHMFGNCALRRSKLTLTYPSAHQRNSSELRIWRNFSHHIRVNGFLILLWTILILLWHQIPNCAPLNWPFLELVTPSFSNSTIKFGLAISTIIARTTLRPNLSQALGSFKHTKGIFLVWHETIVDEVIFNFFR